jgi:hypothetical protein
VLLASGCASSSSRLVVDPALGKPAVDTDRVHTMAFAHVEDDVIGWLAAADPRLALRADATAPEAILKRVGMDAVMAEDVTGQIRGSSLDLFAFEARERALDAATKSLSAFHDPLPAEGPLGSPLARPKLERELLERVIAEESDRAKEEAKLGDASGELVRGIVSTWTPPAVPQDWPDRDVWVSKHLLEIRDSLRDRRPRTGPSDLDVALYPLERLLAPMQFPRGSAAIAQLRMAIDEDMRAVPKIATVERIARSAKTHLGVSVDPAQLRSRLDVVEGRLRELAVQALVESGDARKTIENRARALLFVEASCPAVPDARVRSMAPPPERTAICGALRALSEEPAPAAALVALHDDVLLAFAAIMNAPPPRTGLLSNPEDADVEALERTARERPVLAIGVALAAELLYAADGRPEDRVRTWRMLGEAPLDIVERELRAAEHHHP